MRHLVSVALFLLSLLCLRTLFAAYHLKGLPDMALFSTGSALNTRRER